MKLKYTLLFCFLFLGTCFTSKAQSFTPPNLDFELGTTADWLYYKGTVAHGPVYSLSLTPPIPGLHTITSGSGVDIYGGFSIVGNGLYSLKIGKDSSLNNTDAASYNIHIPTGGTYSVIYHYAAVLENPAHSISQQPRFEVSAVDSATGIILPLSLFSLIPTMPGFIISTKSPTVLYKTWTTGSLNMAGYGGHTVILKFIGAGCSASGHFGYAYMDVSSCFLSCLQLLCNDTSATLIAPSGYSAYQWTDSLTFTKSYGTTQTVTVTAPTVTTTYAVILTPFTGHGITDTLYTTILPPILTHPSRDTAICLGTSISLTPAAIDLLPLTYSWTPSTGLSCTTCDTTIASPPLGITKYMITVSDTLGCSVTDTINITVDPAIPAITGTKTICTGSTTTFSDASTGGTWTSACTPVATIGTSSGIIKGITGGTATITYTLGCSVTTTSTVYPTPSAITGASTICTGYGILLSDSVSGGVWSSSNTMIAAVGSTSGYVTGISAGTATISYTIGLSCTALKIVTVNLSPAPPTGITTICVGGTTVLSDATIGGLWTSANTAIATIGSTSGIVSGTSAGIATILYTLISGCYSSVNIRVNPLPPAITGKTITCIGSITILSDTGWGTWTSSSTLIATVGVYSGVVSGISSGTATITYTLSSGCSVYATVTVLPYTPTITGTPHVCVGSTTTLSDAISGGTWSSSAPTIATVGSGTGIVTGISTGIVTISYAIPAGCMSFITVTVTAVSAASSTTCGDLYTLTATGGSAYSWAPSTGLSCSTCSVTTVSPLTTTTYTVTGTTLWGCPNTATVTVNGDRIFGHITFGGLTPDTLDTKVWLIQYNPLDSSIKALDSTLTCVAGSITYYEFDTEPSGNYMVKAKLLFGNPPGSSGYVPTYSLSTPHWDTAATITHTGGSDSLHITMVYGTVPTGPGFIGGYVYSGAGKGTSDAPVSGMLIFLENASSHVLIHTYTDVTGAYSFTNLAYGDYLIYPEDYDYKTNYASIILNDANPSAKSVDFRQYLTSRIIIPYTYPNNITPISSNKYFSIFPNPTTGNLNIQWTNQLIGNAGIEINDVLGHKLFKSVINMNTTTGQTQIKLNELDEGIYTIIIKSESINYYDKLIINKQ